MPLLIPDIKLVLAKRLLNKLNSDEELLQELIIRHNQRKTDVDKYSKVLKEN